MTNKIINSKGLTFKTLFKINVISFSVIYGIFFLLGIVANIFEPSSIEPTESGYSVRGLPAIGFLLLLYPVFVIGHSLIMGSLMSLGQNLYTKFKTIDLTIKL